MMRVNMFLKRESMKQNARFAVAAVKNAAGGGGVLPSLFAPQAGSATADGATNFGVSTNLGKGTLYWAIVTNAGVATNAQVIAGSGGDIVAGKAGSQALTTAGAKLIASVTGLSAATLYQIKFVQQDAPGNISTQVSVDLTTTA